MPEHYGLQKIMGERTICDGIVSSQNKLHDVGVRVRPVKGQRWSSSIVA